MASTTDTAGLQRALTDKLAQLISSDDWKAALETAAQFHDYSWGNTLLISAQCPNARRVAGYRTWQSLGRQVRKGESSIRILAPVTIKDEETDDRRCIGFRAVSVFDISQTDGDDLAEVAAVELDGNRPSEVWDQLRAMVADAGYSLEWADLPAGHNGCTEWKTRRVVLANGLSEAQQAKTLAHELAHIQLGHESRQPNEPRGLLEVEAESVAYMVMSSAGVVSDSYSLPYVASWSNGDVGLVKSTAERVVKVAAEIIDRITALTRDLVPA